MDLRARRATVRGEVVSPFPGERRLRFGWLVACAAIVGSASVAGGCGGEAALDGELHLDLVDRLATAIVVGEPLADSKKKILVLSGGSSAAYSFFARGATALRVEGLVVDESGRLDVWVSRRRESLLVKWRRSTALGARWRSASAVLRACPCASCSGRTVKKAWSYDLRRCGAQLRVLVPLGASRPRLRQILPPCAPISSST